MFSLQARDFLLDLGVVPVRVCELDAGLEAESFHTAQRGHGLRVVGDGGLVELWEVHANVSFIQAGGVE